MADVKDKEPLNTDDKKGTQNGSARRTSDSQDSSLGPPIPPDGGYGWVIMCASFVVSVLVDGVCFSFGIFFLEFLDHYQEGKEKTAWAGSVLNGMYLTMGPLVGALTNKFGCRIIAILGSIISAAALFLSTFSPNIYVLIITYGLLTGAGFGLMYLPAIVMVGYYFEKRRALATGIAVCGSGIGGFLFAPMCEKLIEAYAWRGATWIIAGICLNGMVCGFLFKPIERPRKRTRTLSSCSAAVKAVDDKVRIEKEGGLCKPESPLQPKDLLIDKLKHSLESEQNNRNGDVYDACSQSMQNLSHSTTPCTEKPCLSSASCDDLRMRPGKSASKSSSNEHHKTEDIERPMYRKDILYSGSIQNLPEYKKSETLESYVRSVTSIPDHSSGPKSKGCRACDSLTDTFKEMMDFTLLKNPVFCIYGLSCFLCMTGFFVPFIYLPDLGISFGLDRSQAAFLISIIGIANTVARVLCGWVSDQSWADCLIINNCALVAGGVATMLVPFCKYYWTLSLYSFVFGTCIAAFVSLRSIIMVELMGLEKLTSAFGLVTLCQGLSSFIGAPIAGALFDATGYYNLSFYVAGTTLALAGAICFPLRRIALWHKKRQLMKEGADGSTLASSDNVLEAEKKNLVNKSDTNATETV